jgi:redox-sensitive bicupin YhaK (pirin superfamily)
MVAADILMSDRSAREHVNDEEFPPRSGFDLNAHRDVEIVTRVRSGAITVRRRRGQSLATGRRFRAGDERGYRGPPLRA